MERTWQTCDNMTEIDGILLSDPSYGLSISDAMSDEMFDERMDKISITSEFGRNMRFVCIRDDALDGKLLAETASKATNLGLGIILESPFVENLRTAALVLEGRRPMLSSPDSDQDALISLASDMGLPVMISSYDLEELVGLSAKAESLGCEDIVLNPVTTNLSQCLTSTVELTRMASEGNPADRPIGVRSWSGEFALAVASVAVQRGGMLAILDDLDPFACTVLDTIIDEFSE